MIQDKMDFSMYINRFFIFLVTLTCLSGCSMTPSRTTSDWFGEYGTMTTGTPVQMQYGTFTNTDDIVHRMAVLLPLSGQNASIGNAIRTSVELATLQRQQPNLVVTFYDTAKNPSDAINDALATNPEIIIGPVFSSNAQILRNSKPEHTPVLSFTSDATAIDDGVMTMALMPTNSIEAIIREMKQDGTKDFIIIAPETKSGTILAGTARAAATEYDIPVAGVFYYKEQDTDSIKNTTIAASMNPARRAANTRAREILSDILTKERLTAIEKSSLSNQLAEISQTDTLGNVPYNAILFLGNADDTKKLASFLRYYGVGTRDVQFYGTAMWDGSDIGNDITMSGAKFATLTDTDTSFANTYEQISGTQPSKIASFGYDATNMAIGMIYSDKTNAQYLMNPSGYIGNDGLFRLKPTGESERALRIVQLNGTGTPRIIRNTPTNFITPLYNIESRHVSPARAMELQTPGVNPNNYISIPDRLRSKYRSKTYGANMTQQKPQPAQIAETVTILPEDDSDVIVSSDFTPVTHETVNREYIDSIEIEE